MQREKILFYFIVERLTKDLHMNVKSVSTDQSVTGYFKIIYNLFMMELHTHVNSVIFRLTRKVNGKYIYNLFMKELSINVNSATKRHHGKGIFKDIQSLVVNVINIKWSGQKWNSIVVICVVNNIINY